jgi:hypothetical protein
MVEAYLQWWKQRYSTENDSNSTPTELKAIEENLRQVLGTAVGKEGSRDACEHAKTKELDRVQQLEHFKAAAEEKEHEEAAFLTTVRDLGKRMKDLAGRIQATLEGQPLMRRGATDQGKSLKLSARHSGGVRDHGRPLELFALQARLGSVREELVEISISSSSRSSHDLDKLAEKMSELEAVMREHRSR